MYPVLKKFRFVVAGRDNTVRDSQIDTVEKGGVLPRCGRKMFPRVSYNFAMWMAWCGF